MCRILYVAGANPFECAPLLNAFAEACRISPEYQGHGWGIATRVDDRWNLTHSISPIWDDDLNRHGIARALLVHARSAFRDEGIAVENNMPFSAGETLFAFNGELHGVRIREHGRIGAEKIFNFLLGRRESLDADWERTISEGARVIASRSRRVRAMNFIIVEGARAFAYSTFDERPEYFTMHLHRSRSRDSRLVLCSVPLPSFTGWEEIPRGAVMPLEIEVHGQHFSWGLKRCES